MKTLPVNADRYPDNRHSADCKPPGRAFLLCLTILTFLVLQAESSFAWIYPEHRDITVLAVEKLNPGQRVILDWLWADARTGHEGRLCAQAADTAQAEKPSCIDWAAWPAIAGDHSCSGEKLVETVLATDWILNVAGIAAKLKKNLAKARNESERTNYLRDADIAMQRADQGYATRAGANNAHFLLARPDVNTEGIDYVRYCLREGADLNALGIYAWYHLSALGKASGLSRKGLSSEQRAALARAVLADEAFALHFLEDTYASGHVAGTWGDPSQRKGTHDYYNEHGLEVLPWKSGGKRFVLMGDAHMRPEDAERSADEARESLEQILDAAIGRGPARGLTYDVPAPDPFDVCKTLTMPRRIPPAPQDVNPLFRDFIQNLPVPGLGPGVGSLPRFRAELGPFIGLAAAASGRGVDGGFGETQTTVGTIGSLEGTLRIGFGLEGVLDEAGDGLVFLDLGIRQDSASTMKIIENPALAEFGAATAAIPSRTAYTARLRMPFWLIPGDLILALPLLATSPETYAKMAVLASNGGLIPWQTGIATPVGRFQFVLGREVGVSLYGYRNDDRVVIPPASPGGSSTLISLRSTAFDFPVLEYRPFRTFSLNQSSSLVLQLFSGFEVPHVRAVIGPPGQQSPI